MTSVSGLSNSTPVVPPLFALVKGQNADLVLQVLEAERPLCFPEELRFLSDSALEIALEGLRIYEDGLEIIMATHVLKGSPNYGTKCFGLTQGTACIECDEKLEDNQFGAKVRAIGIAVSADPVWMNALVEEEGFDPFALEAEIATQRLIFVFTCDRGHMFESHSLAVKGLPCSKCGDPIRLAGQS